MDETDTAQGNRQGNFDNRQEPMRRLMKDSRGWQGKEIGPGNVEGKIPPLPTWMRITNLWQKDMIDKLCCENRKLTRYLRQREQKKTT